ncbi:replication initiation protein [Psychrobacter sp. FME5]|uniref:replication initiation protein n=1 Tax=Psychrobacter sp. FME5 TaxID=2487706 RepID=UPI0017887017|nr:replication initiation protein [Psychrobacter sp. FME5]MBE0446023.1 replication initiation protein [Psychrobacter sp. FME5]
MKDNLVVKSNDLVIATYTMTTKEKELLLACISQIDSRSDTADISKQTKFTVTVQEMKDLFYKGKSQDNAFRDLEQASNRLFDREVTIKLEGDKWMRTRFVSSVLFNPDSSEVTLAFAEDILPYLTQLKANFTKYKLIEITELSSIHAIRLYELIVMWVNQYQYSKQLDLDDFRYIMGVKDKYKQFGQLRERVIETAISEINENTNYKISVEYRKVKRTYVSLTLKFHKKTLAKLANKSGVLSQDTIESIVNNVQFMNDYNDHPLLSYEGKMNTDIFKREMINIVQREPESFNKKNKGLEAYLPKVKQGR